MEEVVTLVEEVHMQVRGVVHTQLLPAPLPGSEFQPLWCFGIHARLHLSPIADNSMDRGIIVCAWADTLPFQHRAGADGVVHMAPQREVDFIVEQQRLQVPSSAAEGTGRAAGPGGRGRVHGPVPAHYHPRGA
eukprot:CAMPEP_0175129840 /NCGR_PEP_ID=MMETSP0087-20121206/5688_1 /TAXON_ID=136419 /ORGANISM="Unknown Unknown, Strain D1" /LENGTH=132 /DNA_ID=CAMNT_0016412019 /DNA_START=194 /DNA_END=592 /DNA_ORIENTATION=+